MSSISVSDRPVCYDIIALSMWKLIGWTSIELVARQSPIMAHWSSPVLVDVVFNFGVHSANRKVLEDAHCASVKCFSSNRIDTYGRSLAL